MGQVNNTAFRSKYNETITSTEMNAKYSDFQTESNDVDNTNIKSQGVDRINLQGQVVKAFKTFSNKASTTTPDYTDGGFMRGNLHQLKVGNYLDNTPGIITSLSYTINMDGGWELEKDKQWPYIIDVSLSFTPIHNFLPRRGEFNFIGKKESFDFISAPTVLPTFTVEG